MYRTSSRESGSDETEASVEFLRRTVSLRRALILCTVLGGLFGGCAGVLLYVAAAKTFGANGMASAFPVTGLAGLFFTRSIARRFLRSMQAGWAVELGDRCGVPAARLLEIAAVVDT